MSRTRRFCAATGSVLLFVGVAGCQTSTVYVLRYPDFYSPELKRVAVVPLRPLPGVPDRDSGVRLANKIEGALVSNRTYEVYTRQHLRDLLSEDDLMDSGIIKPEAARRIGERASVQAIVCGSINRCEHRSEDLTRIKKKPVYGYDARGVRILTGYRDKVKPRFRNEACVESAVVLIETATGRQLGAASFRSSDVSEGKKPKLPPQELLRRCEEEQVAKIIAALAAVEVKVKLPNKVLRIAQSRYGKSWHEADTIHADRPFYIVVSLPPEFDKNSCDLVIVSQTGKVTAAEHRVDWSKANLHQDYVFDAAEIMNTAVDGRCQAQLYYRQRLIASRSFKIDMDEMFYESEEEVDGDVGEAG